MTTIPTHAGAQTHAMPRASSRDGAAPLRGNQAQLLHTALFVAGAVLLPGGLIVIGLGWYGAAHTPYEYDQTPYLISGGVLGLGITFVGGFLYFGSWLARIAADQKDSQRQLAETLLVLADAVSHNSAAVFSAPLQSGTPPSARPGAASARARDAGSVLVVAGGGKTVHRGDCDLIAGRQDVSSADAQAGDLVPCRLCQA